MGFTAKLVQAVDLRVIGAEIAEEVIRRPAVVTKGTVTECSAEGSDSTLEYRKQRMLQRRAARALHNEFLGRGRMRCAALVNKVVFG